MKTTDPTEVVRGALSNHEAGWAGPARSGEWLAKAFLQEFAADITSDGVDGPDELAASVGKSARGICVAGRVLSAADVKRPPGKAGQESAGCGSGRT